MFVASYNKGILKFQDSKTNLIIDIHESVLLKCSKYLQFEIFQPESGGILIGYHDRKNNVLNILDATIPDIFDVRKRKRIILKSKNHNEIVKSFVKEGYYYVGNWHTHPQSIPTPSVIDWEEWKKGLHLDKVPKGFQVFIIFGNQEMKIWIGNEKSKEIYEIFEANKINGIYQR